MRLTRRLYPTGRAFRIPIGGDLEKMHEALVESEKRAYDDAISILDSIIPDNDNFTTLDATQWEQRLGMITNPLVSLADRKLAIIRKMNHPGDIKARQSADYLQNALQAAGFVVYVHENIPEMAIEDILVINQNVGQFGMGQFGDLQFGSAQSIYPQYFVPTQFGSAQFGSAQFGEVVFTNKVANHIDEDLDKFFNFGQSKRAMFIIGGQNLGDFEDVDINRKEEFRQLILKLKPTHAIAALLITYS